MNDRDQKVALFWLAVAAGIVLAGILIGAIVGYFKHH
jgi:hypothetical protein